MTITASIAITAMTVLAAYALWRHLCVVAFVRDVSRILAEQCHNIASKEAPRLARRMARTFERYDSRQDVAGMIAGDQLALEVMFEAEEHRRNYGHYPEWY